jgi:hypothetical protein
MFQIEQSKRNPSQELNLPDNSIAETTTTSKIILSHSLVYDYENNMNNAADTTANYYFWEESIILPRGIY